MQHCYDSFVKSAYPGVGQVLPDNCFGGITSGTKESHAIESYIF